MIFLLKIMYFMNNKLLLFSRLFFAGCISLSGFATPIIAQAGSPLENSLIQQRNRTNQRMRQSQGVTTQPLTSPQRTDDVNKYKNSSSLTDTLIRNRNTPGHSNSNQNSGSYNSSSSQYRQEYGYTINCDKVPIPKYNSQAAIQRAQVTKKIDELEYLYLDAVALVREYVFFANAKPQTQTSIMQRMMMLSPNQKPIGMLDTSASFRKSVPEFRRETIRSIQDAQQSIAYMSSGSGETSCWLRNWQPPEPKSYNERIWNNGF